MTHPTQHELFQAKARRTWGRCTAWRLGYVIGQDGADLESPYTANTRADRHYRQGLKMGQRRRAAVLAAWGPTKTNGERDV